LNVIESPVLPEASSATCVNCGAALVPDQRYCLTCGHPCSPVRLAFLDVLQNERAPHPPSAIGVIPGSHAPGWEPVGSASGLQRYSGVFGLLTLLLVAGLIGLLVGHWVTAGRAPTQSVYKIEGLGGLASAAAPTVAAATTPTPSVAPAAKGSSSASSEAHEAASEAQVKAPPPAPKKASSSTLNKLAHLKGKKYQQEINKLTEGDQPIETGGG
jgi:predicted lipid-binding transport protein (Tim44 family)